MDYITKIKEFSEWRRTFKAPTVEYVESSLFWFYKKFGEPSTQPDPDHGGVKEIREVGDEVIIECQAVYTKPAETAPEKLAEALGASLPESFKEIYRHFGEVLFVTRAWPLRMRSIDWIIEIYEDESYEGEPEMGRFFRFADYPGQSDPMFYGLRKNEFTDAWEVVLCTYGLLYNEMIGEEGRDSVKAPSFEHWLEERWLERDGRPDYLELGRENDDYMEALPDGG